MSPQEREITLVEAWRKMQVSAIQDAALDAIAGIKTALAADLEANAIKQRAVLAALADIK